MTHEGLPHAASEAYTSVQPIRAVFSGLLASEEVGPLVLAVAFSANGSLAPTHGLDVIPSADVPEVVRPTGAALRTVRELSRLNVPLAFAGSAPEAVLRRVADVFWLRGRIVSDVDPAAAVVRELELPPPCIWFVTGDADEALRAHELGMNAVECSSERPPAIREPDERGLYVVGAIDGVLEAIRIPYTRSALSLRRVVGALLDPPPAPALRMG